MSGQVKITSGVFDNDMSLHLCRFETFILDEMMSQRAGAEVAALCSHMREFMCEQGMEIYHQRERIELLEAGIQGEGSKL